MTTVDYPAGSLVNARGRDWLVLPGSPEGTLLVRPLPWWKRAIGLKLIGDIF